MLHDDQLQFQHGYNNTTSQGISASMRMEDTRRRKRQVTSAFNDEIKRLQAEIRDLTHPDEAVDVQAEDLV